MSDEEARAHIKRQFSLHGLDEPTDEQCDAVMKLIRQAGALQTPVSLGTLLRALSPRQKTAEIAAAEIEDAYRKNKHPRRDR